MANNIFEEEVTDKSISELCHIISGGTPRTSVSEYWDGPIPWLSIKDFLNCNRFVCTAEKSITKLGLDNSATNLLKNGDLILSARGTVGEVAIIFGEMAFNQSCFGLRTKNPNVLNQRYLFYWIKSHKIDIQTGAHGAVFNTITRDDFKRLVIPVPSIETQQHIVNTISSLLLKSL